MRNPLIPLSLVTLLVVAASTNCFANRKVILEFESNSFSISPLPDGYVSPFQPIVDSGLIRFVLQLSLHNTLFTAGENPQLISSFFTQGSGHVSDLYEYFPIERFSFLDAIGAWAGYDVGVSSEIGKSGNLLSGEFLSGPARYDLEFDDIDLKNGGGSFVVGAYHIYEPGHGTSVDDPYEYQTLAGSVSFVKYTVPDHSSSLTLLVVSMLVVGTASISRRRWDRKRAEA